jgi:glucosamine--fructose-6-phosphate aminotransferase (isomerizing)
MCGIVGYIGGRSAVDVILDGLKRLEYRGYDSVGVATFDRDRTYWWKDPGNFASVEFTIRKKVKKGSRGIGHTRWATHGKPSHHNAHPHFGCTDRFAVVHNGIIENHRELRQKLTAAGHKFQSETDTEVIVHLVEEHFDGSLFEAVKTAAKELEGSYAIAVSCRDSDEIVAARYMSPLVLGIGDNEFFAASDVPAILPYTKRVIYLNDGEVALLSRTGIKVCGADGKEIEPDVSTVEWEQEHAEKGGYPHYMLKEIYEQPEALKNTIESLVDSRHLEIRLPHLDLPAEFLRDAKQVLFVACGTAYHAGLVGKYGLNMLAQMPVSCEVASEFRYSPPYIDDKTLIVAISQSGETADTLAAIAEARKRGAMAVTICNCTGSSIVRATDGVLYTRAGPEIGVASTKAYTTQLAVVSILTVHLAELRGHIDKARREEILTELLKIPELARKTLEDDSVILECSDEFMDTTTFLYIGRRFNYPTAFEGALKLKEISYIHAEGYGAGEMKHGPIALVQEDYPTVAIATAGEVHEKMVSNIQEIKARGGPVIALANPQDEETGELVDYVVSVPAVPEMLSPIINVIPLQLLAYHIAVKKGLNVDQPRNLAKSVTVE